MVDTEIKEDVQMDEISPYIQGLTFQPAERWKIKIGGLKDFTRQDNKVIKLPTKFDSFLITKLGRDPGGRLVVDSEVMALLQGTESKLTKIDVTLLYDDPAKNMPSFYATYSGGYRTCYGDGKVGRKRHCKIEKKKDNQDVRIWLNEWERVTKCKRDGCENYSNGICKSHAILSVVLSKVPEIGGVARFRTTSERTRDYIYGGMIEVMLRSQGILAGIPLRLVIQTESADTKKAGRQTVQRVALVYPGTDENLRKLGIEVATMRSQTFNNMKAIEKHISIMPIETREEAMAITQEFYPDNVDTGLLETDEEKQIEEQTQEATPLISTDTKVAGDQNQGAGTHKDTPTSATQLITKGEKTTKDKTSDKKPIDKTTTGEQKQKEKTGETKPESKSLSASLF